MDIILVEIDSIEMNPDATLSVKSRLTASWLPGVDNPDWSPKREQTDIVPSDSPATLMAEAKGMAMAWAADPANGGKTLTEDQVIIFGGVQ